MKLDELWKDFIEKLAGNLQAQILIFGVLIVVVVGFLGAFLAQGWMAFVYVVVIGVMIIFVVELIVNAYVKVKISQPSRPNDVTHPDNDPVPASSLEAKPTSSPLVVSLEELRNAYLQNIVEDCRLARLAALDPQAADPARGAFSLDKLYVSLNTRTQVQVEVKDKKKSTSQIEPEKSRPLPALEALWVADRQRMVLLGLPGSGKSTFVRFIALCHAQALQDPSKDLRATLKDWGGAALIPVIIPLGRLAESLPSGSQKGRAELILAFLTETLEADERAASYVPHLLADLEKRGGLFLFDGLDEVADLSRRPQVVQAVEDFTERFGKNPLSRFLVTCRTFSYTDRRWQLAGWVTHELASLDRVKIEQFIKAWHTELIRVDPARRADYESKQDKLQQALRSGDRRRLAEIADNPLILTVMAVVHTNKGELPDARALVYEECIDLLLLRWDAERPVLGGKAHRRAILDALGVPEIVLKNALQEIAYTAHASHAERPNDGKAEAAALVTEDLLSGVLFRFFKDPHKVQTFLDYCESANGLLLKQGVALLRGAPPDSPPCAVYTFPHLTFQEYLAARFLRRKPNLSLEVRQHLDRSDRWREAIMLLGEHLCFREGDHVLMGAILDALAPDPSPETMAPPDWRALWMAGDLLTLYRRALGHPASEERLLDGLVRLLQAGALSPRERSSAGDALAALGDPRFDPQRFYLPREPLLGFVPIPAGPFRMGSDKKIDTLAGGSELPQHEVILPDYYLSRFPVTNAQFAEFVRAGGYAEPRHWPEAIAAKFWQEGGFTGGYDDKPRQAPYDSGQPFNLPNHPVVGVTWYEALAYCRWLGEQLSTLSAQLSAQAGLSLLERAFWQGLSEKKLVVSLPSEAEWEKAARGGDGRIYPWGDRFDPYKANTAETGLGATSPVGCFPLGVSPYGLLDLSGNVLEWTRSLWAEYPYPDEPVARRQREDLAASGPRLWRGGSYILNEWGARCAFRFRRNPYLRSDTLGFRAGVFPLPLGSGRSGALGL